MSSVAVFMTRQDVQIAVCCWVISWPTFQNYNPRSSKKHTTKQSHLFMKTNISLKKKVTASLSESSLNATRLPSTDPFLGTMIKGPVPALGGAHHCLRPDQSSSRTWG